MHTQLMLRRTFAIAAFAAAQDGRPAGAVLVGPDGKVLLEERGLSNSEHDDSGYAERTLATRAGELYDTAFLVECTLYSSAEASASSTGAVYWAGIGRVVFGIDLASFK